MEEELREVYETLLKQGELFNLFPNFSGDWDIDRVEFQLLYKEMRFNLNDFYE